MRSKKKESQWIMKQRAVKKAIRGAKGKFGRVSVQKSIRLVNKWQDYILANIPAVFEEVPIEIKTHIDEQMNLAKACRDSLISQTNMLTSIDILDQMIDEEMDRLFPGSDGEYSTTEFLWAKVLSRNYWAHLCRENGSGDIADEVIDEVRNFFGPPNRRRNNGR